MQKWTRSWTTDHEAVRYQKDTVRFLIYEQEGQQPPFPFLRIFTRLYPLRGAVAKVGEKPSSPWPSQVASGRFTRPCLTFLIRRVGTALAFTSHGRGKKELIYRKLKTMPGLWEVLFMFLIILSSSFLVLIAFLPRFIVCMKSIHTCKVLTRNPHTP